MKVMKKLLPFALALASLSATAPLMAQATNFTLINQTGKALGALSIRRTGTSAWQPLGSAPAAGGQQAVNFSNPDCAFDIQATPAGGQPIVWQGVNLCEVNAVILRLAGDTPFVDYR